MTDDELIARVRRMLLDKDRWHGLDSPANRAALEALDTLARRLEELKDGLEEIDSLPDNSIADRVQGMQLVHTITRSLLHPEPQEDDV